LLAQVAVVMLGFCSELRQQLPCKASKQHYSTSACKTEAVCRIKSGVVTLVIFKLHIKLAHNGVLRLVAA
jgi:hypothetical protein